MWEVAFLFFSLIQLIATEISLYDELSDYWDTNNDGIFHEETIVMFRHDTYSMNDSDLRKFELKKRYLPLSELIYKTKEKYKKKKSQRAKDDAEEDSESEEEEIVNHYEGKQCMHGSKQLIGCHDCYCVGGQIYLCSSTKCPYIDDRNKLSMKEKLLDEKCKEGEVINSYDSCNKCVCENGKLVCTTVDCGRVIKMEHRHCHPRFWYSLRDQDGCHDCVCIDGEQSFCYINYCNEDFTTLEPKRVQLSGPVTDVQEESAQTPKGILFTLGSNRVKAILIRLNGTSGTLKNRPKSKTELKPKPKQKRTKLYDRQKKSRHKRKNPCEAEQYFTLSSAVNCRGCVCDARGRWNCWHVHEPCASFFLREGRKCHPGDTVKNLLTPCSICYCGIEGSYICTTDENCAHHILKLRGDPPKTNCDSIKCLRNCNNKEKKDLGICVKDGCKCM